MHTVKYTTEGLNLVCRALETLAEQAMSQKADIVAQVQAAQLAEQKPPDKPGKKK